MGSQEYLDMMKDIYENIQNFIEEEAISEEFFLKLKDKFNNTKISDNKYNLLSLLHIISKIVNNHHHITNFFAKIEKILLIFKEEIKKYFSNSEIFNIFKSNKRILLFLIEQQIIVFDEYIAKQITNINKFIEAKYPQYFQPEIQPFINEKWFPKYDPEDYKLKGNVWVEEIKKELPENFYEKRKEGENDSQISELIRKDMIIEFVLYVTLNDVSLYTKIKPSIYETNSFLLKKQEKSNQNQKDKELSLIEYAVFFGSYKIFNYLHSKRVKLTPLMWLLAIHSQNAQMIHVLEDNNVELEDNSYKQFFYESIKCHHNDIADYFLKNFLQNDEDDLQDTIYRSLKYHNFAFLENDYLNESSFCNLCKYDYFTFVEKLLKREDIDVNKKEICIVNLIQFHIKIIFNNV